MRGRTSLARAALVAALALGGVGAWAVEGPSPEAVQKAKTPAEHTAIADAYAAQAAELGKKAAEHKDMLASYEKGPGYLTGKIGLGDHCRTLIDSYEKAADAAGAMAKMHRDLAAQAK